MKRLSLLLLAAVVAAPAFAQSSAEANPVLVENARVRSSTPVYAEVQVPRTECTTQTVVAATHASHEKPNLVGAGLGAVAGGLLGHTVGGGNGKTAATAVGAATYGGLFAFISGSSFVLIRVLGVPTLWFGAYFAFVVSGFLLGTFACRRLLRRLGLPRTVLAGAALAAVQIALGNNAVRKHRHRQGEARYEVCGARCGQSGKPQASEPLGSPREGDREAQQGPNNADHTKGAEALHDDAERVVPPEHASVEERESRCHQQDESGTHQYPRGISGARRPLCDNHPPAPFAVHQGFTARKSFPWPCRIYLQPPSTVHDR